MTGVTETDVMDDFITKSLVPFIDEFVPKNPLLQSFDGPGKKLADEGARAKVRPE